MPLFALLGKSFFQACHVALVVVEKLHVSRAVDVGKDAIGRDFLAHDIASHLWGVTLVAVAVNVAQADYEGGASFDHGGADSVKWCFHGVYFLIF